MLLRLVQELPRLEELRVKPLSVSAEACSASVVFNALTLQSQAVRRGERIAACTSRCNVFQASETCSEWTNNFTVASYFLVGVLLRLVHALPQLEGSRVKLLSVSAKACSASARIQRSDLAKPCSTPMRTDCCVYVQLQSMALCSGLARRVVNGTNNSTVAMSVCSCALLIPRL